MLALTRDIAARMPSIVKVLQKFSASIKNSLRFFHDLVLGTGNFEEFREKHLFIARIRIVLFLFCWGVFFFLIPEIWSTAPAVPFLVNAGFALTSLCYFFLLREKFVSFMILCELIADIISLTAILSLFGLNRAPTLLVYSLYVSAVGGFFGFTASCVAASGCLLIYLTTYFLGLTNFFPGMLEPYSAPSWLTQEVVTYSLIPILMPFALGCVLYAQKISHHFSRQKHAALERRNIQLTALNNIGATIRKALSTTSVIEQVLKAVTKGLRFEVCLLALKDTASGEFHFFAQKENYHVRKMQEVLGMSLSELKLLPGDGKNAIISAMERRRVVIRNHFIELAHGIVPLLPQTRCNAMQKKLGFKKFVITPLIAEQESIGAIIGLSTSDFIEDTVIDTLDHFANQAALAIESAELFEALEEKNRELIHANRLKSDFLAIMSHELRTPLIAVIGYSELLVDGTIAPLSDDQKKPVSEILRNAKTLLDLINSVLDLAKIEAGKMELGILSFDLPEMVREVEQTLHPLIDKKSQTFVLENPDELKSFQADPMKIRQILINLVGNAIKFTEKGGRIGVRLEHFERAQEALAKITSPIHRQQNPIQTGPAVLITVFDNGIGIKPENQEGIFELFHQLDTSFTRAHEGTGLGLALTQQLVLLHGGLMTVKSEFGKGSEFFVLIPQT